MLRGQRLVRFNVTQVSELTKTELDAYEKAQRRHKEDYLSKYLDVLEDQLLFKDPLIHNLDLVQAQRFESNPEDLYCYSMFLEPGQHSYVGRAPDGQMIQYDLMCDLREEPLPQAWYDENLKEGSKVKKFNKATSAFAEFRDDSP